jgi:putative membrane protein
MWWGDAWTTHGWMPWMLFGPLTMLIVLAVCFGVVLLVARGAGTRDARPLEILRERFARGEIDEAEFAARRKVLQV